MKHITYILFLLAALTVGVTARAQHTLGVTVGYGSSSARFAPPQETKTVWNRYSFGLTWRHYTAQRAVGCFGLDLEFIQRGYSYATNASYAESEKDYIFYTRKINSLMLPIVWQPHFYMAKRHIRVYFEAAATFSYNLSSTYENESAHLQGKEDWKGTYEFKTARDNRLGYGLAGGAGVAVLIGQIELHARTRYHFGLSDVLRNRNKYYNNATDGSENPFYLTPLRSPMDNLNVSIGVSYRFNKAGFEAWKPRPKRTKNVEKFSIVK